mmetsp:Transcript_19004/g.39926  ORF Transcript_19004/g.39926 Transcript_19004/m.39926 type:complete len:238 (+) Transcript_19004:19-732(+)
MADDFDSAYNPSHPNADWSGYVLPISRRKHVEKPRNQIIPLETGFCPAEDARTREWKPGRKVFKPGDNGPNGASTKSLIGGPIPECDPAVVESSHWQTEVQAATLRTQTTVEQLTEKGKSMHIRGKKGTAPLWENVKPFDKSVAARLRKENPYTINDSDDVRNVQTESKSSNIIAIDGGLPGRNLIGYRANRGGASKSFLAGLGKEVAAVLPPSQHVIAPAPYATDGDLPISTRDRR